MSFNRLKSVLLTLFLFSLSAIAHAETTLVAVASNFTKPMTEIAEAFEKATGHSAKLSFGSSGKHLSHNSRAARRLKCFCRPSEKYPLELEKSGHAVADSRFIYAIGKLVFWSAKPGYVDDQGADSDKGGFKHLALADPKLAPYGVAADGSDE